MARSFPYASFGFQTPLTASLAAVVVAGLWAHLLLLATDYVIWDGWWQFADISWPEGPSVTKRHLAEVGRPLDLVYYAPFRAVAAFSTRVWLAKLMAMVLWVGCACLMLGVMWRATRVPRDVAVAIAAAVASCPVFGMLGEYSLWMYTGAVFLFWLAWFALVHLSGTTGVRAVLARPILWFMFFLSFNLNSQLVAFYGIGASLFASRLTSRRLTDVIRLGTSYAVRFGDFLLLPPLFWLWRKTCTPSIGAYVGYNTISLSPQRLAAGATAMTQELLLPWLCNPLASDTWLIVAGLAAVTTLWMLPARQRQQSDSQGWSARLAIAGLFLLAMNTFPYLAVGQVPSASGWLSRNAILTPLPLAMLAVGAFLAVSTRLPPTMFKAWKVLTVAWIVLNIGACTRNYLALQGFGVKQDSISLRLHEAIDHSPTAAVQMRDYFPIPATVPAYAPSIWTFLPTRGALKPRTFVFEVGGALPDQQRIDASGNPVVVIPHVLLTEKMLNNMIAETTLGYAMQEIPRIGRHVLLCIRPGRYNINGVALGSEYLWRKWLDPVTVPQFVRDATISEVLELSAIRQEN